MKAIFENLYGVTEESINPPFIVQGIPMGIITESNEKTFSVLIWDRFIGAETQSVTVIPDDLIGGDVNTHVSAIFLEKDHHYSFSDLTSNSQN